MYNVADEEDRLMLCCNVHSQAEAEKWLWHYRLQKAEVLNRLGHMPDGADHDYRVIVFH